MKSGAAVFSCHLEAVVGAEIAFDVVWAQLGLQS
jgi:hypothetical protein